MTDNSWWHEVVSDRPRSARVYSPTAFSCRRRSQTPVNDFRTSSSVMFRYRCVILMSECPSINWIVRMSDVDAVRQQSAGAFVTQIVPVQVDLLQLRPVNAHAGLRSFRVMAVGHQEERFPSRLEAVLELAVR
jgi:hypothetical protein